MQRATELSTMMINEEGIGNIYSKSVDVSFIHIGLKEKLNWLSLSLFKLNLERKNSYNEQSNSTTKCNPIPLRYIKHKLFTYFILSLFVVAKRYLFVCCCCCMKKKGLEISHVHSEWNKKKRKRESKRLRQFKFFQKKILLRVVFFFSLIERRKKKKKAFGRNFSLK